MHEYGVLLRNKELLVCTTDREVDPEVDKDAPTRPAMLATPEDASLIEPGSILFYVEDAQFMSASRELKKGMSAWIRCRFVTGDGRALWYTLSCVSQRVWDFETYRAKKKLIQNAFTEAFDLVSTGEIPEDELPKGVAPENE